MTQTSTKNPLFGTILYFQDKDRKLTRTLYVQPSTTDWTTVSEFIGNAQTEHRFTHNMVLHLIEENNKAGGQTFARKPKQA